MPIEVKGLTHIYMQGSPFETRALHDVSLKIEDGEFIGIIGHTGSGKSTLITHLNALERSQPGMVFVNGVDLGGKDVTDVPTHEDVQKAAEAAQPKMMEIMRELVARAE